jgi:CheY-like chemotaxis protein
VPVVALTAFTQDSDREKALASGFTEFTSKPIRPKDIKALLARLGPAR